MVRCNLAIIILLICALFPCRSRWEHEFSHHCHFSFHRSLRESLFGSDATAAPLVIWVGRPSTALRSLGPFGDVPLPTLWTIHCSVLYFHCEKSIPEDELVDALDSWTQSRFGELNLKPMFLFANWLDNSFPGKFVFCAAKRLKERGRDIRGVGIGYLPYTPKAKFFKHAPIRNFNDDKDWTVNRATQPVICNTWLSELEFVAHDYHFRYVPVTNVAGNQEMYEYTLSSVASWNKCYRDINEFALDFVNSPKEAAVAALPSSMDEQYLNVFPNCEAQNDQLMERDTMGNPVEKSKVSDDDTDLRQILLDLLGMNVSVLLYSSIHKSSSIACSFYIGIFEADALQFQMPNQQETSTAISSFNKATLEKLPPTWSGSISEIGSMGHWQRSINTFGDKEVENAHIPRELHDEKKDSTTFSWIQFNLQGNARKANVLSKYSSLELLNALVGAQFEVDLVETITVESLTMK